MTIVQTHVAILIAIWCFDMKAEDAIVFRHSTSFVGEKYEFVLDATRLAKTPSWRENQECPPLSPRKALAVGQKYLARMVKDAEKWQVEQVTLRSAGTPDKWIYLIEVRPPYPVGGQDGKNASSTLVVLMDGTALEAQSVRNK